MDFSFSALTQGQLEELTASYFSRGGLIGWQKVSVYGTYGELWQGKGS